MHEEKYDVWSRQQLAAVGIVLKLPVQRETAPAGAVSFVVVRSFTVRSGRLLAQALPILTRR
jgi:hypothetical protein